MLKVLKRVNLKLATDPARGNVQTFLERLLVEVTAANYRYFLNELLVVDTTHAEKPEHMCWPPLLANERQVSGLFATALSALCPISRPEHSISRTLRFGEGDEGETTRGGRIDFLATYGNRDIALELKRLPISSIGEPNEKQVLADRWADVSTQSKQALAHMRAERDTYLAPVSVGLMVVRVSRKVTSAKSHEAARGEAAASLAKVVDGVRKATKPDFLAYYKPPVEMQTVRGWGKDGSEFRVFPGVIFAAVVHGNTRKSSVAGA